MKNNTLKIGNPADKATTNNPTKMIKITDPATQFVDLQDLGFVNARLDVAKTSPIHGKWVLVSTNIMRLDDEAIFVRSTSGVENKLVAYKPLTKKAMADVLAEANRRLLAKEVEQILAEVMAAESKKNSLKTAAMVKKVEWENFTKSAEFAAIKDILGETDDKKSRSDIVRATMSAWYDAQRRQVDEILFQQDNANAEARITWAEQMAKVKAEQEARKAAWKCSRRVAILKFFKDHVSLSPELLRVVSSLNKDKMYLPNPEKPRPALDLLVKEGCARTWKEGQRLVVLLQYPSTN